MAESQVSREKVFSSTMALPYQFVQGIQVNIMDHSNLVDDSMDEDPMVGLLAPSKLHQRLLDRLSTFVGARTSMNEDTDGCSIDIIINSTFAVSPDCFKLESIEQFLKHIRGSLELISTHRNEFSKCDQANTQLWNAILAHGSHNVSQIINDLKYLFDNDRRVFEDCITKTLGLYGDIEELDAELGNRLIKLARAVHAFSGDTNELSSLVHSASHMLKDFSNLHQRLRALIQQASFAMNLYTLIYALGFPHRLYGTLIRAAAASITFKNITFRIKSANEDPQIACAISDTDRTSVSQASSTLATQRISPSTSQTIQETVAQNRLPNTMPQPGINPSRGKDWIDAAQPYLSDEDKACPLHCLQPRAKVDIIQLIGTILCNRLPPKESNAWFNFGFVTARDAREERSLRELYAKLLNTASEPNSIFRQLLEAVTTGSLVQIFDSKEYTHVCKLIPDLEAFLNTPTKERWTVWRLKQYLQTDQTALPLACLQRDYGFWYCTQQEHVDRLKAIYKQVLARVSPKELHEACTRGRLLEIARRAGVFVHVKYERLMGNDYPSAYVGYDNDEGLTKYRGSSLKNKRGR